MAPAAGAGESARQDQLTLRVLGRRADGYHDIESLVAFAGVGDALTFTPGGDLALTVVDRPPPPQAMLRQSCTQGRHALAERVTGLRLGWFTLSKRLPVAAGLAAVRRTRPRLCGCWRGRTRLRRMIPVSCRRRARPALTCRYALTRTRASCAASETSCPIARFAAAVRAARQSRRRGRDRRRVRGTCGPPAGQTAPAAQPLAGGAACRDCQRPQRPRGAGDRA